MRFKIQKHQFDLLKNYFDNNDNATEIDLEPIVDTAREAIYEQEMKNKAFEQGGKLY